MRLQVAQRAAYHGVRDRRADRAGDDAAGVAAQVQLGAGALPAEVDEAPLAREVPEVPAEVLAAEPVRRLVDLAELVVDPLDLRIDLVLDDRAAPLLVALEHLDRADRPLPVRDVLEVRQGVVALLRRGSDLLRAAFSVVGHGWSAARGVVSRIARGVPAGPTAGLYGGGFWRSRSSGVDFACDSAVNRFHVFLERPTHPLPHPAQLTSAPGNAPGREGHGAVGSASVPPSTAVVVPAGASGTAQTTFEPATTSPIRWPASTVWSWGEKTTVADTGSPGGTASSSRRPSR